MPNSGKRWTVQDREGNLIYLTEERWRHITDAENHPEIADYEEQLKTTIQKGRRGQEPLNPRNYRYSHSFDDLPNGTNDDLWLVVLNVMSALFGDNKAPA